MARTGQVSGKRTSLLNSFMAKPVLALKNGKMALDKIYFGSYRKAWAKYINSCLSRYKASDVVMFVTYVGLSRKDLDWVKQQIELKAHFKDVIFIQASPAIAVNCGPGTFGLLFMDKELKKYDKS
jgi:fatty acid-binding protein DegV